LVRRDSFANGAMVAPFTGLRENVHSLQKRAQFPAKVTEISLESRQEVQSTCRMVRAALRYSLAQYTCLEESLTLWYLLRRQGTSACLRIGVRKENEKLRLTPGWNMVAKH